VKKALFLTLLLPAVLAAAELKDVKSVYLYPMVGGLDQHLANRLVKDHLFRVVTDPKLADAVFTDQIGNQFEYRLDHIKRDPVPGTPPAATALPNVGTTDSEPHSNSFSRGRGTVFLVDAKSKQVVWSDYRSFKGTAARDLDRTAKQIAMKISKTLAPPPAAAK
jgi:hypothetical protein